MFIWFAAEVGFLENVMGFLRCMNEVLPEIQSRLPQYLGYPEFTPAHLFTTANLFCDEVSYYLADPGPAAWQENLVWILCLDKTNLIILGHHHTSK